MKFLLLACTAALAAATPTLLQRQAPIFLCPALDTPLCCQLDVDGVLDVTCESREFFPLSLPDPLRLLRLKTNVMG